jgi:hypothetical protein
VLGAIILSPLLKKNRPKFTNVLEAYIFASFCHELLQILIKNWKETKFLFTSATFWAIFLNWAIFHKNTSGHTGDNNRIEEGRQQHNQNGDKRKISSQEFLHT